MKRLFAALTPFEKALVNLDNIVERNKIRKLIQNLHTQKRYATSVEREDIDNRLQALYERERELSSTIKTYLKDV